MCCKEQASHGEGKHYEEQTLHERQNRRDETWTCRCLVCAVWCGAVFSCFGEVLSAYAVNSAAVAVSQALHYKDLCGCCY